MKNNIPLSRLNQEYLYSTMSIRERSLRIFEDTLKGKTSFIYNPGALGPTISYVLEVIQKKYPDLKIPPHSRWGHFRAGGLDRVKGLDSKISSLSKLERAKVKLDLVIPSVLLDAGAGADWSYLEDGKEYSRSEGLGLASFHMFLSGAFSSKEGEWRTDALALKNIANEDLMKAFQVSESNPLVGVEGRVLLLKNLGRALENRTIFREGRPGNLVDYLMDHFGSIVPAQAILHAILEGFASIWPGRLEANGRSLGDVWHYSPWGAEPSFFTLLPFHKLSQWMTYSLIEPIQEAGIQIVGIDELTGLPEYRNGGLLLDSGLISLKNPEDAKKLWAPDSNLVLEWRALTVHLLDEIAIGVRKALKKSPEEFPLAMVLEGGTWWAGRFLAEKKRAGAVPPLQIKSDGTVF